MFPQYVGMFLRLCSQPQADRSLNMPLITATAQGWKMASKKMDF